jgi:hypothetical protein
MHVYLITAFFLFILSFFMLTREGMVNDILTNPTVEAKETMIKLPNRVSGTVGEDITFGGNINLLGNNLIEMGKGFEKEGNAGKIAYNKWGEQLDIIGAGKDEYHRKMNLWDDVEISGGLDVKQQATVDGPLAVGSDISGNPGTLIQYDDLLKRTDIKGYGEDGSRQVKLWDNAEVGFLDVTNGMNVEGVFDATILPKQNHGLRVKKGLDVVGELNANNKVYIQGELTANDGAYIEKGMNVKGILHANDLLKAHDGIMVDDVMEANKDGVTINKRVVVKDIMDANNDGVWVNKPLNSDNNLNVKKDLNVEGKSTLDSLHVKKDIEVDGDIVIGKGNHKWFISVGNNGQLEFMHNDKRFKNTMNGDTDKGHIVMVPDGNLWLSRSTARGWVADQIGANKKQLVAQEKQNANQNGRLNQVDNKLKDNTNRVTQLTNTVNTRLNPKK